MNEEDELNSGIMFNGTSGLWRYWDKSQSIDRDQNTIQPHHIFVSLSLIGYD